MDSEVNDKLQAADNSLYRAKCLIEKIFKADQEVVCEVFERHLLISPSTKIDLKAIKELNLQISSPITAASAIDNRYDSLEIKYSDPTNKTQIIALKMVSSYAYSIRQAISHQILLKSRDWIDWQTQDELKYPADQDSQLNQTRLELQILGIEHRVATSNSAAEKILATEYKDQPGLLYIRSSPIRWIYVHSEDFSWGSFFIMGWAYVAINALAESISEKCLDIGIPMAQAVFSGKPIEIYLSGIHWMGNDSDTGLILLLNQDAELTSQLQEHYGVDNSRLGLVIHRLDQFSFWTMTISKQKMFSRPLWNALQRIANHLSEFPL